MASIPPIPDHFLSCENENKKIPLVPYQPHVYLRLGVITAIVLVVVGSIALAGKLPSLSLPTHASWQLLTGTITPFVLIVGGVIVIRHARKSPVSQGAISGTDHWRLACHEDDPDLYHYDFSSRKDSTIRYYCKTQLQASLTGFGLALLTPIYTCVVVVYNLFRFVLIPFYILVRMVQERNKKPLYPHERKFTLMDIPRQMAISLGRMLQAPFYGTALFYAALKAVIDPLNGIKEGAGVEFEWNNRVPRDNQGIWMMACKVLPGWRWEGGGGPERLGNNGFYVAGSWQSILQDLSGEASGEGPA